ncbi:hypothetical protein HI914_06458 [Erysiphe necator]|nr:hypothetical protein HI914_06458 [Erysiphe necator]
MWGKRAGAYERKRSPPSLPSSGVSIFDSSLLIEFKNYYSTSVILFRIADQNRLGVLDFHSAYYLHAYATYHQVCARFNRIETDHTSNLVPLTSCAHLTHQLPNSQKFDSTSVQFQGSACSLSSSSLILASWASFPELINHKILAQTLKIVRCDREH